MMTEAQTLICSVPVGQISCPLAQRSSKIRPFLESWQLSELFPVSFRAPSGSDAD